MKNTINIKLTKKEYKEYEKMLKEQDYLKINSLM